MYKKIILIHNINGGKNMKKILYMMSCLLIFCGCTMLDMKNTPTKQVEKFFNSYQILDKDVLKQIDKVVDKEPNLTSEQKEKYREILKNHYEKLDYEVKEETINGDKASVKTEIEVYDYTKTLRKADEMKLIHEEQFYDDNSMYSEKLFQDYRLRGLKDTKDRVKYTLYITLTKIDGKWTIDELSELDQEKILGIYVY